MDFNEWLLEDRMAVIKDVLVKQHLVPEIILTKDSKRDVALISVLKASGAFNDTTGMFIPVSSKKATGKEKTHPQCAVYDSHHNLIFFYPLKVCDDKWIDWYLEKENLL